MSRLNPLQKKLRLKRGLRQCVSCPSGSRLFFLFAAVLLLAMIFATIAKATAGTGAVQFGSHIHATEDLSNLTLYLLSLFGAAVGVCAAKEESVGGRFSDFIIGFCTAFGCAPAATAWLLRLYPEWSYDKSLMAVCVFIGACAPVIVVWGRGALPSLLSRWLKTKTGISDSGNSGNSGNNADSSEN